MASGKVVLLNFTASHFATRARIALSEKEVVYETQEEDLLGNKSALLLQMNPVHKQVPVLIHNDKPICESLNIVQYIDEVWNKKSPFLPSDPYQRAQARFWADYVDKKVFDVGKTFWTTKGEVQDAAKKELIENLKVMEGELGDKAYFGGENFGFVDLALIPVYAFFHTYESLGKLKVEAEWPKLVAWTKKCTQKDSVSKSLCDQKKVYEVVLKIRKVLGVV